MKRSTIQKGFVHELLNAQDTVLCSYFAQRSGAKGAGTPATAHSTLPGVWREAGMEGR